ncbi:nuclear transport factor 2 family protein [Bradyrhizobium mercantei]|uniref:nuclear transport factor 2 family protein n=1 Tax=Bradyrhizobium mercantei TaxID=1904807 RepID=UPI000977E18B|nr:nuclear transport factor 2 family protein [Bradyrhizobium mercantei]
MSFDPMAAAVDWLDAYRAGDLEDMLGMYAEDAVIYCDCGSTKTLTGREALRAYWIDRLKRYPAFELDNLRHDRGETAISYFTGAGLVNAVLTFDAVGQIKAVSCGQA